MSLSAVLKYMTKQAVDCRNMVVTVVWHTHTTVWLLKICSQRILTYYTRILLLELTYGRTMVRAMRPDSTLSNMATDRPIWSYSMFARRYLLMMLNFALEG